MPCYIKVLQQFDLVSDWNNALLKIRQEVFEGAEEEGDETKEAERKEEKQAQVFFVITSFLAGLLKTNFQVEIIKRFKLGK